jgi:Helicase conserved C-terminal domain
MDRNDRHAVAAAERAVSWLKRCVIEDATGEVVSEIETQPSGTFWLGRLSSIETVLDGDADSRGDRLDPCSMGMRVLLDGQAPWTFRARVSAVVWLRDREKGTWKKSPMIDVSVSVTVSGSEVEASVGEAEIRHALTNAAGVGVHAARIDISSVPAERGTELTVTLVNCSPRESTLVDDTRLYQCELKLEDLPHRHFALEALPDSFRYDRNVPAYGINCGVMEGAYNELSTKDDPSSDRYRPRFWPIGEPEIAFQFAELSLDPVPKAVALAEALKRWGTANWSDAVLAERSSRESWTPMMYDEAKSGATEFWKEVARLEAGICSLRDDADLLQAFKLMNASMRRAAEGKYDAWRPFQFGFLLANLTGLATATDNDIADVVWFATGGGKTETYLGLLVTAAFLDRLRGKSHGITAWSRFPLRMLSLQQTQRFANALAGAELIRRERSIGGQPFSLGFFVGGNATPNSLKAEAKQGEPDPDDPEMPARYKLLEECPFCHQDTVKTTFDHETWTLRHTCTNQSCAWPEAALPIYVVDDEVYRFLPTVVVGTLDKAANLGMQAAMRGFVGPPLGMCSVDGHGHVYAKRSSKPNGCLVPGCRGERRKLPQPPEAYGPTFRLQDELHLLRDSLGAVDAHYEALLDEVQEELCNRRPKILASSATLAGYAKQVGVLYRRDARVFPQPSSRAGEGFWSSDTDHLMRRFVALAPRGVTIEHAIDRILTVLQKCVRRLATDPDSVCAEIGVDRSFASDLIDLYGTDVVYGNALRDLDAVERSIDGQQVRVEGVVNSASLTGRTGFKEVRETLKRLETPETDYFDRVHVVTASSMMSHGVDIDRLNVMVMIGLPLGTAEFIQTTARVGRTWPGLVFVLHKIGRERDAAVFRAFDKFVEHGDRFVEPIPITRRSRRVLERTLPGLMHARLLHIHEAKGGDALTRPAKVKALRASGQLDLAEEERVVSEMLELDGAMDQPMKDELAEWMRRYSRLVDDPPDVQFSNQMYPGQSTPMRSLRDVEDPVNVYGREEE